MTDNQDLTPNANDVRDSPDDVVVDAPDTVATPEGDNEYAPGQPLGQRVAQPGGATGREPGNMPPITRPRGDEPHTALPYRDAEE